MSAPLPHSAGLPEARASALALVPRIVDLIHPTSVVDVGCGTGGWLSVFAEAGVGSYLGIDGPYVRGQLLITDTHFMDADLSQPLSLPETFDLVVSVEVAEHLPPEAAETYVSSLSSLGDLVVFSAATPGQHSPGHVNLQWPAYWTRLFARHGFLPADPFRRAIWNDERIAFWYRQNVVLYGTEQRLHQIGVNVEEPLPLLHPGLLELLPQEKSDGELVVSAAKAVLRRARRQLRSARRR